MTRLHCYLTFNGNCKEAMTFYKNCLGGELIIQTIGESPMAEKMPASMKPFILHSTLTNNNLVLMGSDMVDDEGLQRGNSVSLMLHCSSKEEIHSLYEKLSDGGDATHPVEHSFWGALFGDLTDRFGNRWLLHYPKNS